MGVRTEDNKLVIVIELKTIHIDLPLIYSYCLATI